MSCDVLVIPEDPTYNGAIVKPLVFRILQECGKANARVTVLENPRVRGFEDACKRMPQIVERYSHLNLLLFLPDADGKDRSRTFARLEAEASERGVKLICCAAQQEVEVWLMAGHVARVDRPWTQVRANASIKEQVFAGFLREFGDTRLPGEGRGILMQETLRNYGGLLERCPELAELEKRIRDALS